MITTILLVDDSRTSRLLARASLIGRGYEFIEVDNGATALRVARKRLPDLVICNVFMPGVDGWDFVRALRRDAQAEVAGMLVVLVSSKQDKEVARRSIVAGANAFLTKPIDGEQLIRVVDSLIGKPPPQSGEVQRSAAPISHSRLPQRSEAPKWSDAGAAGSRPQEARAVGTWPQRGRTY